MKTRRILTRMLALPAALAASTGLAAVENVLVTGTYAPRAELTASTTVLDRARIAALDKRTVGDLLKTVPGLLVEEQGGPGGLTAVSIRGGESNFTLVLLDGVPVNDPTNSRGGSYDFANLNAASVERIEIVRGTQSAIYGSDALAGAINIITRRPEAGHRQEVYAAAGQDDYSDVGVTALGLVGDLDYALEVASRDDGEPITGSTRDSDSANLRLGWQVQEGQQLQAGYRYIDGNRSNYPEQGGGPEFAPNDDLDHSDYQQEIYALGWNMDISAQWRSSVDASRFEQQEDYRSPGIPPYFEVPPNAAGTEFTRDLLQWVNSLQLSDQWQLDLGTDWRDEHGESRGYLEFFGARTPTDFELDRSTTGVFASLNGTPLEVLGLHASVRYDDPEDFDSETSVQLGASYSPVTAITLSANWGEAYKLPSFFALGHALVGNPDLQPEQARSWDLGIGWDASGELHLQATAFFNDYQDLVDFDDETFRNVNRQQVETSGVELQADWQLSPTLVLAAQATYTDIDVIDEDSVLTGRPDWTATLVARWNIATHWHTALDFQHSGEQWAASRYTGALVTEELDSFQRLDWVLQWQPVARWQFTLAVDNLLDANYATAVGFDAAERSARLGLRYTHE